MTTLVRLFARPALSAIFVTSGVHSYRHPEGMVPAAEPVTAKVSPLLQKLPPAVSSKIPTDTVGLVKLNGGVHAVAGALLSVGKAPRLAAGALALSLVPTTVAGHPFWTVKDDPAKRQDVQIHFLKNLALLGGLLIAAVDTEGKPGVPWRARRAARDVQRSSKVARRQAKLQVKAAKAQGRTAGLQSRRAATKRAGAAGHAATAAALAAKSKVSG